MNNRNTGIIATIAAVVLCGCPGLFACLFGALTAAGQGTFNDAPLDPTVGFVLVCLSLILLLIPAAVWFFTLRKKPGTEIVDDVPPPPPVM
jgi:integral membrane sensor domain MASE1